MKVVFHGAAREVTGSCHRVGVGGKQFLLDCGMIQGGKERHERNREPFPFSPKKLDCVVLSHAHIDHSGRLPLLVRSGFRGPILATAPTVELCKILLPDSAHIQEEDARWKAKRLKKRGLDASWVKPLYTQDDVDATLERFVPIDFGESYDLDGAGSVRFARAGHILGAGTVELNLKENGTKRRLTFSGDLGVHGSRLLGGPETQARTDYLILESTYGDRSRDEGEDRSARLLEVIQDTVKRGGKVVVPSFAVGRTQEVLARINDLVEGGRLDPLPVFVDSPMARNATRVFAEHSDAYSEAAKDLLEAGDEPLEFPGLQIVRSVDESKAINAVKEPCVIISASGMCTAGRIKHHLKNNIADPRNTILFVGYQAQGTLGRLILSGLTPVRIFDQYYPVRAKVEAISGFSAHADRDELLEWFAAISPTPRRTFLVHGEEEVALRFADTLADRFRSPIDVPHRNQGFDLD